MELSSPPLVSVITTVFNREEYIEDSIKSVLASTYQNFELIIVDDRSTDNSFNIATEWSEKDSRIKVFKNEVNLGDYPNRNKAASYATGKYLKYVDADDMIYPHCLEVMVRDMEANPQAALGLSIVENSYKIKPYFLSPEESIRTNFLKYEVFLSSPLTAIINREKFNEVNGFSGKKHVSDKELWFTLASKYGVLIITFGLVFWRSHGDQQSFIGRTTPNGVLARYQSSEVIFALSKPFLSEQEMNDVYKVRNRKYARLYFRKILRDRDFQFASAYKKGLNKGIFTLFKEAFL